MLNLMGLLIIIIMVAIVLLPFNDKFWTYITKDRKHEITNFIDYSDYELDLNSIITDYQSGVLDKKEFNEQLNSFQKIINKSSIDKHARLRIEQLLEDQNLVKKYLTKLDEITSPKYIDEVMKIIKPEVDEYMSLLHLEYPQFKIEDELKRLKENAAFLRGVYLYPELPFNAFLSDDRDSLSLVNRKPVPIKIIALVNIKTGKYFNVKGMDSDFVLAKNSFEKTGIPTKISFECPGEDCFSTGKIENLRIRAKVLGTSKETLIKINNWNAYDQ